MTEKEIRTKSSLTRKEIQIGTDRVIRATHAAANRFVGRHDGRCRRRRRRSLTIK